MLVSFMVNMRKVAQLDEAVRGFREINEPVRDLEIRRSGGRRFYFLFKTGRIQPFIDFTKGLTKRHDFVRDDIEFAYDDGVYHEGIVDNGEFVTDDEHGSGRRSSAWIFLKHFFEIEDDMKKLHKAWEEELKPSPEESKKKREDLDRGKAEWDAGMEVQMERWRKRVQAVRTAEQSTEAEPARGRPFLPRTRREITEEIERINRSGLALVPFAVFPTELSKALNPTGLSAFASFFDKSEEKGQIFTLVKKAFQKYRES